MRMSISLVALSAVCLLAGCATEYQPEGVSGGYSDKVLAGNTVQVTFRGNRITSPETVHFFLLRRCAEVTLQDDYNYFVLVHEEKPNEGNTDDFGSTVGTATIEMYRAKPQAEPHTYDASLLLRKLLADEGESEEPRTPAEVASANHGMPPPIPGAAQPPDSTANARSASSTSHLLSPNPNPNALTNTPVNFDRW
ncbi:MAG: CC0125/CC1285 family lipoprotein [Candidatus Binatus sp.]